MKKEQNIGKWTAIVSTNGNTPQITVDGTFPTNGEKPGYDLIKNDPQGINPSELLLTLVFGELATKEGTVDFSVQYNEDITPGEKYSTVLVIDENSRTIASINVSPI